MHGGDFMSFEEAAKKGFNHNPKEEYPSNEDLYGGMLDSWLDGIIANLLPSTLTQWWDKNDPKKEETFFEE